MEIAITTRAQGRDSGAARFYTGKPCKYGHVALRITSSGLCTECVKAYDIKRGAIRRKDPAYKAQSRARFEHNYYGDKREEMLARGASWRAENREYHKKLIAEWDAKNPHKRAEKLARYRAGKLARTLKLPPELAESERKAVASIYEKARAITTITGIPHEVDHIVPLQGRRVCGLHVSWNLQVIPLAANRAKGNRWTE